MDVVARPNGRHIGVASNQVVAFDRIALARNRRNSVAGRLSTNSASHSTNLIFLPTRFLRVHLCQRPDLQPPALRGPTAGAVGGLRSHLSFLSLIFRSKAIIQKLSYAVVHACWCLCEYRTSPS